MQLGAPVQATPVKSTKNQFTAVTITLPKLTALMAGQKITSGLWMRVKELTTHNFNLLTV